MISALGLTNFKCFISQSFDFGQLNVLAGSNGTGKSSVIQALLVLFQSVQSGAIKRQRLQLNGPLIELGTGNDVMYKRSDADRFEIYVRDEVGARTILAEVVTSQPQHTLTAIVDPPDVGLSCFTKQLFYISADRIGPQKMYPMNLDDVFGNEVGRRGEFAPLLFSRSRGAPVTNDLLVLEDADKNRFGDVETQFTLWMKRLFPGFALKTDSLDQLDQVALGLSLQKQIGEPIFLRPSNVGFGVSFVLPIILAGILSDQDSVLIVENPEAHLHPSAQSLMGEFLARVSAGGAQVFVETHSDHVVNGMRIAFKNKILAKEGALRFFAFSRADEYGSHRVSTVALDDNGDFIGRPDLFFDQADKDLKLIYGL